MEKTRNDKETATYAVHLPDGREVITESRHARGDWAIANVQKRRGAWRVEVVYDAKDAETMRKNGSTTTTAERISQLKVG